MSQIGKHLTVPRLILKPREVAIVNSYIDHLGVERNNLINIRTNVEKIVSCINNGLELPSSFYRKGIDSDKDYLLEQYGIMHLHLNGKNSDELLYLKQYDNIVIFLEISDHSHFQRKPVGDLLVKRHTKAITDLLADKAAKVSALRDRIKLSLIRKKEDQSK